MAKDWQQVLRERPDRIVGERSEEYLRDPGAPGHDRRCDCIWCAAHRKTAYLARRRHAEAVAQAAQVSDAALDDGVAGVGDVVGGAGFGSNGGDPSRSEPPVADPFGGEE